MALRRATAVLIACALSGAGLVTLAPAASASTSVVSIQAPPLAALGQYNWLSASVTSSDGSRPSGGVQFLNAAGQVIATAGLSPGESAGTATASAPWVPTQLTDYSFTAVFQSTAPGMSGAVTSQPTTITTTPNGSLVQLAALPMTVGVPSTLVATVYPSSLLGSVSFGVNGFPMSASIPIAHGTASFTFTPRGVGWQRFDVSFTVLGKPDQFGAVSQWVNVVPA